MPLFGKKKAEKKPAKKTFPKKADDNTDRILYLEEYNKALEVEIKTATKRVADELRVTIARNKAEIKRLKKG